ncbi:DUF2273 domain-containing protein [Aquipuribacter hungaricus]|uniref:DUF2273 domain-containing protein n=1 Tax=Aquipuribacter hungaricus TaxID=545624 RepID=A0ABV7WMN7_9MICO
MRTSTLGLVAGLLLALAATTGGLTGFLLALVLGGLGYALGLWRDGEIDPTDPASFRPRGRTRA